MVVKKFGIYVYENLNESLQLLFGQVGPIIKIFVKIWFKSKHVKKSEGKQLHPYTNNLHTKFELIRDLSVI